MSHDRWFYPLDVRIDFDRLVADTDALLARVPLAFDRTRQLALHMRRGTTDPWYEGCRKQRHIEHDSDYNELNPGLIGTCFAELFERLPFRAFRARLMSLDPSACYSIHVDETPRYHMAIHTSEWARLVFVNLERVIHIPADGRVY